MENMNYERFSQLLSKNGLTAYAVAKSTGISPMVFSDWKNGKSKPKIDKIIKISDFFNVPVTYFIE